MYVIIVVPVQVVLQVHLERRHHEVDKDFPVYVGWFHVLVLKTAQLRNSSYRKHLLNIVYFCVITHIHLYNAHLNSNNL